MRHSLLMLLGCTIARPAAADPTEPDEVTPSAAAEAVYHALSVRAPIPTCEEVEALTTAPVETLLYVVENAVQPPWTSMRAATCLITRHAEEVQPQLGAWVASTESKGLGLLTLGLLDELPPEIAVAVARTALEGEEAAAARSRIEGSVHPGVVALISDVEE